MPKQKFIKAFSVYDMILIAMLVAITIAVKTIAGVLVRTITGPLGIPGGTLAGGFYMMWLPLSIALIGKRGAAFTVSLVETVILLITSTPGSHGIWTFLTYLTPALAVEAVMLFGSKNGYNILHFIVACAVANIIGTYGSNLLFFQMNGVALLFMLTAGGFSGAIGGVLGYLTFTQVEKTGLMKLMRKSGKPVRIKDEDEIEAEKSIFAEDNVPIEIINNQDNNDEKSKN
jgi:energy-coupling factor transport system substrate-specific component